VRRHQNSGASSPSRKRREKPRIDDLAAAVILQSYLDTLSPPRELPS